MVARRPSATYRLRKFVPQPCCGGRHRRDQYVSSLDRVLFVGSYTQQHRLLRELRDEAFANALWGAMSAQSNADALIQRAEDVGVSDDRILMLRGQRHLYGGDPAGAVKSWRKPVNCMKA